MQFDYDQSQFTLKQNTITKAQKDGWSNTILLGKWIDSNQTGKYICTLKMSHITHPHGFMVGIVACPHNTTNNMYSSNKNGYAVMSNGRNWIHGNGQTDMQFPAGVGVTGDLFILTLDLNTSKLYLEITNGNGKQKGKCNFAVAKSNRIKYKFAMSIAYKGHSVNVIHIKDMSSNGNNEEKEQMQLRDENQSLKQKAKTLQQNKSKIIREKDASNEEAKKAQPRNAEFEKRLKSNQETMDEMNKRASNFAREIQILQTRNESKCKSLKNEISLLKQAQNAKDTEIQNLKNEKDIQMKELKAANDKVAQLENEQKQLIMDNNELKKENQSLKIQNLNPNEYLQWKAQEIVCWIVSLDPKIYQKYESQLINVLTEDNVDGNCLSEVDTADVKSWGINDFMHRKKLMKSIKALVAKQNNNKKKNT